MKKIIFWIIIPLISGAPSVPPTTTPNQNIICAEYIAPEMNVMPDQIITTDDYNYEDGSNEDNYDDHQTKINNEKFDKSLTTKTEVKCSNKHDVCYAVWKIDENKTVTFVRQGCWHSDDKQETCAKSQCISDKPKSWSKNHRFCCCSGHLCNINVTSIEPQPETTEQTEIIDPLLPIAPPTSILTSPIVWICITIVIIILLGLTACLVGKTTIKSEPELAPLSPSGPGYSSNLHNVDNLKLCNMIGQGKFSTVWKGMINEQAVAVKIFPAQHKQYFLNEKNIYSLDLMESPHVLEYYGCDTRRTLTDNIEYLLVLALAPYGCLQDWLMTNTCSFDIFSNMAKSITGGLSHLHTAMMKNTFDKPCVCHRDLNTRNILVKADLSCCISDFGFALKAFGPRYEWKGEVNLAETKSINEVGTLRYMAPEILEGAVNLRDCETALKQIDVYSLGLVLWEICVRCHDWYPTGQDPPPYRSPYEEEAGKKLSFEQMQILISRHKARPKFPPNWGGDTASKIAKETCEDCWDHDAEARLTALCAKERIYELSVCNSRPLSTNRCFISPLSANSLISSIKATTITKNMNNEVIVLSHSQQNDYQNNDATIITPPNQIIPIISNESIINPNGLNANLSDKVKNLVILPYQNQTLSSRSQSLDRNTIPQSLQNQIKYLQANNENSFSQQDFDELIPKKSNLLEKGLAKLCKTEKKLKGWYEDRGKINKKLFDRESNSLDKSNLVDNNLIVAINASQELPAQSTVFAVNEHTNSSNAFIRTDSFPRPKNLDLPIQQSANFHSQLDDKDTSSSKRPPGDQSNETFTVISSNPRIVVSKSANAFRNGNSSSLEVINADDKQIKRQRSLEVFHQVFGSKGSIERLRDPSERVKTPGDVPASVRKVRASKTLSLYDDRMMNSSANNTL